MGPLPLRWWAPLAAGVYLACAVALDGSVPFTGFPMFQFPSTGGEPTAVPFFTANGERADIEGYGSFRGIDPETVDVGHAGLRCSVEHALYEQRAWLRAHMASSREPEGPVRCAIGLDIIGIDSTGRVQIRRRIDATGTCRAL